MAQRIVVDTNVNQSGNSSNPAWMVTFLRFSNRSPKTLDPSVGGPSDTRSPLVVISDCVSLSTSNSKGSPNGSCQMVLKMGDINYLTGLSNGDYFIVNMVDSEAKQTELYKRVHGVKGAGPYNINTLDDGFKGVYRVQSVHKTTAVGSKGEKVQAVQVTGYSFVELNDVIYFNPYLVTSAEKSNDVLFLTQLSTQWNKIIGLKNNSNSVQDLMILLFQVFLGRGINEAGRTLKGGLRRTENNLYLLPRGLGPLLGHKKAKFAADVVNMVCGIQRHLARTPELSFEKVMNAADLSQNGRVYTTRNKIRGVSYAKPEYWNQIKVWDILGSYLNNVVNEMYTAFRPDPVTGNIMPTLTVRQKPFTTETYSSKHSAVQSTRYKGLPRWVTADDWVLDYKLGRDDAARINFVQVFGRSQSLMGGTNADVDQQIAMGNYAIDREDIKRSGLRPLITTSNFDYAGSDVNARLSQAPLWAGLLGDWVIGGHMKMSGEVTLRGIAMPIEVGDNFQFDGIVYHIEGVQHVCQQSQDGRSRTFRTFLQLSSGLADEDNSQFSEYAEMQHTDADAYRAGKLRGAEAEILDPGVSDSQDLPLAKNRANAEKTAQNPEKSFDAPSRARSKKKATSSTVTVSGGKKKEGKQ